MKPPIGLALAVALLSLGADATEPHRIKYHPLTR